MSAGKYNIEIESGSNWDIQFTWTDDADAPIPLSGYQAHLQIRDCPGGKILVDVSSAAGHITLNDQGEIDIDIPGELTQSLSANGVWDLLLIAPGGERTRLVEGKAQLERGVTEVA